MTAEPERRLLPEPTPETRHFWDGMRAGELRLQKCSQCAHVYFPPRPFCPKCASRSVTHFKASGRATLHSYIISAMPAPGLPAPYSVAIVQLEEGPRMMSNVVGCPQTPEVLVLDMPLHVVFAAQSDMITLPQFEPGHAP